LEAHVPHILRINPINVRHKKKTMNSHISALAQTLLIYLIMGVAYFGWGRAITQVLGLSGQTTRSDITLLWLGWAFTLLIFQLLHFLFPLTAYVVSPIFVIGIVFSIPSMVNWFRRQLQGRSTLAMLVGISIIFFAMACWIGSRSMLPPTNGDSGLYHFSAIRWINSFPIVPGLGNLHGRLAFNQSFFTWVAVLNFHPFFNHGRSVANSFLLLLTIATFVRFLLPVLKQPSLLIESHPFQHASALLAFPILGYLALSSGNLTSPSPDLASALLQLSMFLMFAQFIAEWIEGEELNALRPTVLTILAATAITIKLSNLACSAVMIGICIVRVWQILRIRGVVRIILPVVVVVLVWGCRGYVLSGAPLYPSTIGYVSAEWAVPIEKVVDEANWVYSWARQGGTHWSNVLGGWEWFWPWTSRMIRNTGTVYSFVLALVFCIIAVIFVLVNKKKASLRWINCAILTPAVFGFVYWFFTAPAPRFANAWFWCFLLGSALLFLSSVQPLINKRSFAGVLCVVFIVTNLRFIGLVVKAPYTFEVVSSSGWYPIKTVPLVQRETSSGLVVFIPEQDDQCWDAPLPCTPYFNHNLRLRIPGKLASGFTVTMPRKNAGQGTAPDGDSAVPHLRH
jgi:hypothetical protein